MRSSSGFVILGTGRFARLYAEGLQCCAKANARIVVGSLVDAIVYFN